MELTLNWAGLVKPRVIECVEWLQDDAGNEDAKSVESALEEDGASSLLYLLWSQLFVSPEILIGWNSDSHGDGLS